MKTGAATPEQTPVRELYAEGLRYLMGEGSLNNALVRRCEDLERHRIDYMVIGAVAGRSSSPSPPRLQSNWTACASSRSKG